MTPIHWDGKGWMCSRSLTMLNDLHQAAQMGQDSTAHEDGDLLDDLDASVASLPGLLALTHGLEEGQQGGDAQGGRHHGKGTGCGVSHVLVHVVNVRPHGRDHGGQASGLGKNNQTSISVSQCFALT